MLSKRFFLLCMTVCLGPSWLFGADEKAPSKKRNRDRLLAELNFQVKTILYVLTRSIKAENLCTSVIYDNTVHFQAINSACEQICQLVAQGADHNLTIQNQRISILNVAVLFGHLDLVRILLRCNADPNRCEPFPALFYACQWYRTDIKLPTKKVPADRMEIVLQLLKHGAKPFYMTPSCYRDDVASLIIDKISEVPAGLDEEQIPYQKEWIGSQEE